MTTTTEMTTTHGTEWTIEMEVEEQAEEVEAKGGTPGKIETTEEMSVAEIEVLQANSGILEDLEQAWVVLAVEEEATTEKNKSTKKREL